MGFLIFDRKLILSDDIRFDCIDDSESVVRFSNYSRRFFWVENRFKTPVLNFSAKPPDFGGGKVFDSSFGAA